MSKALSRNYRGSDVDARDAARSAARRSGKSLGDWLDDVIRDNADSEDEDDSLDGGDRLEAATRRLARAGAPRSERGSQRWRDEAREEEQRRERASHRRRHARDFQDDDDDQERFDPQAIVDDAAAIIERRVSQSERQTQQALANLAGLIKNSQRQHNSGEGAAMKRAIATFADRAAQSERHTAQALNNIAGLLETGQRDRVEAENGIVTLAERLARIESRLSEQPGPSATVRPIRSALARLESRLDQLSSEDKSAEFEQALGGLDQRLADIARRLDVEAQERERRDAKAREHRDTFERARAAAATAPIDAQSARNATGNAPVQDRELRDLPPSPRRPLIDAVAEITQRQRALEEDYARPANDSAAPRHLDPLQKTIDAIARQLDGVREDATERADQQLVAMRQIESLRHEVQDMAHTLGALAPRASISAVENALRDLAYRVDAQRNRGVDDEWLAPAERIADELRAAIKDLDPSPIVRNLHEDVQTIGRRLDAIQAQSETQVSGFVDGDALRTLTQQTYEIKQQLSALASRPLPLEKIEMRLFDLTQRVDALSYSAGGSAVDIDDLVKNIRAIVVAETGRGLETFSSRLEQLAGKMEDAVARSGAKRFDELGARIEQLGQSLAQRIDRTAPKAVDTVPLETLVAKLAKKIDSALDHKPSGAGFDEIGRKIDRLETRIGEATPTQSFARIEALLQKPAADRQFADLAQRIDLVHKALASRMEHGAVSSEPGDMRYIEELVRGLDQKIGAALGGDGKASDLAGIERQLGELSQKIDRLDDPSANSRLGAYLSRPAHQPKLDEISDRLERMQTALVQRVDENARVEERHSNLAALVEKLAARVNQALDPNSDAGALKSLESQIGALSKQLDRTGQNGDALTAIESRIGDLVSRIEDTRVATTQAAEEAVRRATQDILREAAALAPGAPRADVERELTVIKKAQDESGQRTHETLIAVHETLERVVDRLAMFEDELSDIRATPGTPGVAPPLREVGAPSPRPLAAGPAPLSAPRNLREDLGDDDDLMDFLLPPGGGAAPRLEPKLSTPKKDSSESGSLSTQSDFIAAARRAAQQAAADADIASKTQQTRKGARAALAGAASAARGAIGVDSQNASRGAAPGGVARIGSALQERKRPLLLALGAMVLLVGAYQVARFSMENGSAPAEPAAQEQQDSGAPAVETPPAAKPNAPSAQSAPNAPSAQSVTPPAAAPPTAPEPPAVMPAAPSLPRMIPPPKAGRATSLENGVDTTPTGAIVASSLAPQETVGAVKMLASKGDATAQFEYAVRLAEGRGVARDAKAAAQWFEKAAAQGLAPAQYRVGSMYEKGVGVDRSYPEARKWYQMAAEAGNARAMHNLAVLLAEGGDAKPDYTTASGWFRKASEYGVRDSQYNLAILYARGLGVTQSLQQSYLWFSAAADQGDDDARKKRDEVGARLDSKELGAAKALVASFKPKEPQRQANDVLPPPGGWEAVKESPAHPAAKPSKGKSAQL